MVLFASNSETFEVCCCEIDYNEAISTTMLKRRDAWAKNKSKATPQESSLLKSHQCCCWSVLSARDLAFITHADAMPTSPAQRAQTAFELLSARR